MSSTGRQWPWWHWALTGLSALALALSGYLGWHYLTGSAVIGCSVGSSCDQVLNSRWSSVGGVLPVSGLAEGVYLAVLMASFFIGPGTVAPVRRLAWRALLILTGAAAGGAIWFVILQKWVIGSFCPYCMATHVTGLLLAALVIWRAPSQFDNDSSVRDRAPIASRRVLPSLRAMGFAGIGLTLAGGVAICQVRFAPPAVYRAGEAQSNQSGIDFRTSPMIGSPDAANIVMLLFDYKCPHCQQMHFLLNEVIRRYDGKLAFVLCPTPLNKQCNPYVPRDVDEFKDSCELTKIALAVWVAKRDAFPTFDNWMFSLESGDHWEPRSLDAARAKAVELVGEKNFNVALADPWIARYLQTCIGIYGGTVEGGNAVPKLVFGSRWVIPQPNDADDLIMILQNSLSVPKP